jgi:hypothetical protein
MGDMRSQMQRIKAQLDTQPRGTAKPQDRPAHQRAARPAPAFLDAQRKAAAQAPTPMTPAAVPTKPAPQPAVGKGLGQGEPRKGPQSVRGSPWPTPKPPPQRVVVAQPCRPAPSALVARQPPPPVSPPPPAPAPVPTAFRSLPRKVLTRQPLFRQPADWVAAGQHTQRTPAGHRGAVDIYIGLDFGTSFTKAAVGFMDKIFPVTWEGVSQCTPSHLLPSEYTRLNDGTLHLGQHPAAMLQQVQADLKLPFLNPALAETSISPAATFLALVLQYIRAWVFHHHGNKLGPSGIRWQVNIGSPSNGPDDRRLVRAYRRLLGTAWLRSLKLGWPARDAADLALWAEGQPLPDLLDLQVHAEFVAQMAGYMQSPKRQRGLHALVDVGGGTLDVVTFIVHQVDDEDTFPFLVSRVQALGTHGLLQNRLVGADAAMALGVLDGLAPIPTAPVFADRHGIPPAQVADRDTVYREALCRVIAGVFELTKNRRYRLSNAWTTGVRTFFTGGGCSVDLYQQALRTARVPSQQGLHLMPLPPHGRLDGFGGGVDDYQRISVACGLAQDSFTLGRIVPASEVEDDTPELRTAARGRPDRDDLYPK